MKLSAALLHCAIGSSCLLSSANGALRAASASTERQLQNHEPILSYTPMTQVTDTAAIDLDQMALESMVADQSAQAMERSLAIYTNGAFSQSYAVLTLNEPLDASLNITLAPGATVSGRSFGDRGASPVLGKLMDSRG